LPLGWPILLCYSAGRGDLDLVQALLNRGAQVDAGQNDVKTPFFIAAKKGHIAVALHLAEHGATEPLAQFWLGHRYSEGKGTEQNESEAIKWFKKAADQGFLPAVEALGLIHALAHKRDPDTAENLTEALFYLRLAARQGSSIGQFNLATMLMLGEGTAKDPVQAIHWYRQSANQGHAEAQQCLAQCLRCGAGTEQDLPEALKWFQAAAEQGLAEAQWNAGEMLFLGMGVTKNTCQALRHFIASARQGFSKAQRFVGSLFLSDIGVRQNPTVAIDWLERAARQGDSQAQYQLAQVYLNGKFISKDLSRARELLLASAKQGNTIAQRDLANLYLDSGTHRDFINARCWFRKAAKQGDADARCALGWMRLKGKGVKPRRADALDWFAKAATQGHTSAIKWLIRVYLPPGRKRSLSTALQHFFDDNNGVGNASTQNKNGYAYLQGPPMQRIPAAITNFLRRDSARHSASGLLAMLYPGEKWLADQLFKVIKMPGITPTDILKILPEALSPFTEQDERHDAQALNTLAKVCFEQRDTGSTAKALNFLHQAAVLGSVSAQRRLGSVYRGGEITKKNASLSMNWLHRIAGQSDAVAERELARLYLREKDTEHNLNDALPRLLDSAAQQGDAIAQRLLGRIHLYGTGTKKDPQAALSWLGKAAAQGDAQGLFTLAKILQRGWGVRQNPPEARKYFQQAALLGHTPSQVSLGTMYWQGAPKNLALAVHWLRKADANGNNKARPALARIVRIISNGCTGRTRHTSSANHLRLPRCGNTIKQRRCRFHLQPARGKAGDARY